MAHARMDGRTGEAVNAKAMTAARMQEIRERIEADGPACMRCAWCREEILESSGPPQECLAGPCERNPGDVCQQDRGELFDELERAQVTASDFGNALAYVGLRLGRLPTESVAEAAERLLATLATVTAERDDARWLLDLLERRWTRDGRKR